MNNAIERLRTILLDLWPTVRWRVRDRSRHYAARLNRCRLDGVTFVGITGSAGKTTTKELVTAILSAYDRCQSLAGSGNDHEMIDRLILATRRRHRFSVAELSATAPGYLDRSLRVLRPQIGVLTLIAREHYSVYRTLDAVAAEKGKLIDVLPPDGAAVLNIDDPLVRAIGDRCAGRIIWVGEQEGATLRLLEARSNWPEPLTLRIRFDGAEHVVRTRLHGPHLALPVICALGVAIAADLPLPDAISAVSSVDPVEGRMQVQDTGGGGVFIRDDFKAPEWSLRTPLEFMRNARAARKIAIIGTISDTPNDPARRYAQAARQALEVADLVVLVGSRTLNASRARAIRDDGSLQVFRTVRDAAQFLREEIRAGDLVLLKGTNKQDHLVRLLLDRHRPVQCWEMSCGRLGFCGSGCSMVYRRPGEASAAALLTRAPGSAAASTSPTSALRRDTPIVVGLGNPGARYTDTPHNVGQRVLDALASSAAREWEKHPEGFVATLFIEGVETTLFKPGVFVNQSGPALQRLLAALGASPKNCVVVLDDMDLFLGDARLKRDGSDAGHQGMRSITVALETDLIPRIRIGVRRAGDIQRARELVLSNFSPNDQADLAAGLQRATCLLRNMIKGAAPSSRQKRDDETNAGNPA